MLIEADLLDTHVPLPVAPSAASRSLFNQVQALKLDVQQIVPIHGNPIPWSDFMKAIRSPQP
jgi:hypothetical protein